MRVKTKLVSDTLIIYYFEVMTGFRWFGILYV